MDSKDSLNKILRNAGGKPAPEPLPLGDEEETLTLADMDGSLRPANKMIPRIHFVTKDGRIRTFQFAFLDSESTFEGGVFTLLFAGVKHILVTVKGHGPKFWMVYDMITLHRWPYLRAATGSMPEVTTGEAVFTSIEFKDVTPRHEE